MPWLAVATAFAMPGLALASPPAPSAPADEPANAVVLFRPLHQLRTLLQRPNVAAYLEGPLRKTLMPGLDPPQLHALLANLAPIAPDELGLGLPTTGLRSIDALVRVFMLSALVEGAQQAGAAGRRDRPRLQRRLASELRHLRLPNLQLWAELRDPTTAKALAKMMWTWIEDTLSDLPVHPVRKPEAMGIDFTVGSVFTRAQLTAMLVEMGLLKSSRDPSTRLSRSILSARTGAANARLRTPVAKGPFVAWSRYPCAPLARQLRDVIDTWQKLSGPVGFPAQFATLVDGLCGLIEGAESMTVQEGEHTTSRIHLRTVDASAKR